MKKMMLICSLMLCVIMAACSKKSNTDSDQKEEKTEFNAKKVVEKINNGEELTDEEFLGAVQFTKDALDALEKAKNEENPDIEALQKKYEGIETICEYVDNQRNWIGYDKTTLEKAAKILGVSTDQLKSAITSGDDDSDSTEYLGYDEDIEIEPDVEVAGVEYDSDYDF